MTKANIFALIQVSGGCLLKTKMKDVFIKTNVCWGSSFRDIFFQKTALGIRSTIQFYREVIHFFLVNLKVKSLQLYNFKKPISSPVNLQDDFKI